jgi:glucose-1-phosphate cytidylyltransferase
MKVVIFAGGLGTRISEESHLKPKPMIEIGGKPILWHIMNIYASHGYNEFIICCGYKGWIIKEYFKNYFVHNADMTIDLKDNKMEIHNANAEPFKITMIDTGVNTMTAGRLKRVLPYTNNEPFMLTYGDGVSDVNIKQLVEFHEAHGKVCTMTTVQPTSRFGVVKMDEDGTVLQFEEKPEDSGTWINGGFFVLAPKCIEFIANDQTSWEAEPLTRLASENQLMAFTHNGFWQPMDTLREKNLLEDLWANGKAPWRTW